MLPEVVIPSPAKPIRSKEMYKSEHKDPGEGSPGPYIPGTSILPPGPLGDASIQFTSSLKISRAKVAASVRYAVAKGDLKSKGTAVALPDDDEDEETAN